MVSDTVLIKRIKWILSLTVIVAVTACAAAIARSADPGKEYDITSMVMKIRTESDNRYRYELSKALAEKVAATNPDKIGDAQIDDIVGLLGDADDSVRYWAALALGQIGPRANRAVPALERALRDRECEGYPTEPHIVRSITSADGIRTALEKIGAKVPASLCGPK